MFVKKHILYIASFTVSVILTFHTPLISLFAIELGASPFDIGLITGIAPFFYVLAAPLSGFLLEE